MIMDNMYGEGPDGLCGNDDAGQMSAWYVFSALGFYPVCPGSDEYAIGSPLVVEAKIRFESGRELLINTVNQGPGNRYIEKVTLNGKEIKNFKLQHSQLAKGGKLVFYMKDKS